MAKDSLNSEKSQEPFQKFENLVRRLIAVPKREADKVQRRMQRPKKP
jgi:hypothetical protein